LNVCEILVYDDDKDEDDYNDDYDDDDDIGRERLQTLVRRK
jgi:hypothetical protein